MKTIQNPYLCFQLDPHAGAWNLIPAGGKTADLEGARIGVCFRSGKNRTRQILREVRCGVAAVRPRFSQGGGLKRIRIILRFLILGVPLGCSTFLAPAAETQTPSLAPTASLTRTTAPTMTFPPDPFVLTPENASSLALVDKAIGTFIRNMAWSPDGRYIAAAFDGHIHLFDGRILKEVRAIPLYGDEVLAFSPDGKRIFSNIIGVVKAWNVETGDLEATYPQAEGADNSVFSLAIHPDGSILAIGDMRGRIFIVDANTSQTLYSLESSSEEVRALAFDAEGKRLASAGNDGMVIVWDLPTRKIALKIEEHPSINQIAFGPDGNSLIVGVGKIRVWSLDGELLQEYGGYADMFAFNRQGALMATGGRGFVQVWDFKTQNPIITLPQTRGNPATGDVSGLAFSPDGKLLASADTNGSIKIWGVPGGYSAAGDDFMLADRLPAGQYVVTSMGQTDCDLQAIDILDGTVRLLTDNVCLQDLSAFANGTKLAFLGPHTDAYRVLDVSSNMFTNITVDPEHTALQWSPDGVHIASHCVSHGHCIAVIRGGIASTLAGWESFTVPVWSPDGKWIAFYTIDESEMEPQTGTTPANLMLADAACLEAPSTCPEKTRTLLSMKIVYYPPPYFAWSPDGRFIALAAEMGDGIKILDAATGRVRNTIPVDDIREEILAWSPDGKWILFAEYPGVIYRVPPEGGDLEIVAESTGHVYLTINVRR